MAVFLWPNLASAQSSQLISIQGKIVNQIDGTNLEQGVPACILSGADTCDIKVNIYDESSAGNLLWSEVHSNIELGDRDGIFNLKLNSFCSSWSSPVIAGSCAGGSGIDWGQDPTLFTEIVFDDDGNGDFSGAEVFSRSEFTSVPFAYYAESAASIIGGLDTVYDQDSDSILNVDQAPGLGFVSSVSGDIYFNLTDVGDFTIQESGNSVFSVDDTGNVVIELGVVNNSTATIINSGSNDSFQVYDMLADATPFVIDSDGNVGIGTGSPSAKLEVQGDTKLVGNMVLAALGTPDLVMDGNDAYIEGNLEVDGLFDLADNFNLNSNEAIGFRVENADSSINLPTCDMANQGRIYYDTNTDGAYLCTETSPAIYEWFNFTPDPNITAYGELYTTDSVGTQNMTTSWTKLTALSTVGDTANTTVNGANQTIVIVEQGGYLIDVSLSFASGGNNRDYDFAVAVNGVVQPDLQAAHTTASNGDRVSFAIVGLSYLNAGDVLELMAKVDSDTTISAIDGNMRIVSANAGGTGAGGNTNLDYTYDVDGDKTLLVDNIAGLEFINAVSGNIVFDLQSSGDFVIEDNNVAVFTVQDDGNVGIGTSSATQPLHLSASLGTGNEGGILGVDSTVNRVGIEIENIDGIVGSLPSVRTVHDNQSDLSYVSIISGEAFARMSVQADGKIEWGDGVVAADTNLYRLAVDTLRTDDSFSIGGNLILDNDGSAVSPALYFGTDSDTGIFHSADVISFTAAGSAQVRVTQNGLNFVGKTADPVTPAEGDIWYRSDLNLFRVYSGGSIKDLATVSVAQAYQSGTNTINGPGVKVDWDGSDVSSRIIDSGYNHSTSVNASRIQVNSSGLYDISYSVTWDTGSNTGKLVKCDVLVNNTPLVSGVGSSYGSADNNSIDLATNSANFMYSLSAGDYYEVRCALNFGNSNPVTVPGQSWTKIKFIR